MRRLAAPLLLLALLATTGCEDSSTEPDRTLTFSGSFDRAGAANAQDHPFSVDTTSNVRIRLTASSLNIPDSAPTNAGLIIGLGRPGATVCLPSSTILYAVGDVASHGLRAGAYCLSIRTPATIPETPAGGTATYTVAVEITD
jgi:hypothetical protein